MFDLKQLEIEVTKAALQLAIWEFLGFVFFMVVLYFVVKAAVRDGVNESRMGAASRGRGGREPGDWAHHVEATKVREVADKMPPIRAD
ncbi:MAG: hypothetical protein Q8M35_11010 [Pseudohongiella sp.]|nr:hypothetical protein [Pseudohongiella sp.]